MLTPSGSLEVVAPSMPSEGGEEYHRGYSTGTGLYLGLQPSTTNSDPVAKSHGFIGTTFLTCHCSGDMLYSPFCLKPSLLNIIYTQQMSTPVSWAKMG